MRTRDEEMLQAATMYYVEGETMNAIARALRVSRSTVSRLLKDARESGMVRISIHEPRAETSALSAQISQAFSIRCSLVGINDGDSDFARLNKVARVAARNLNGAVYDGATVGVAWGTTLGAVVSHLSPRPLPNLTVVQLNGAANQHTTGIPYVGSILSAIADAFAAQVVHFPVPAFFDFPETKQAMWRERTVQRVLEVQHRCDVVMFGVGSMGGGVPSHVYSTGYLDEAAFRALADAGVVGDICTVLLREDGSFTDIELNRRGSGPTPADLAHVPTRMCVSAGAAKVRPLLGALRANAITDLIIDEPSARLLARRAGLH